VVAATNKDLEQAVADGQFREDLFFRLNVVCINMPPLRERREEIPVLTDYFLKKYSVQYNKPCVDLSPDTMQLLVEYDWPGNIRELENLIKRAVVLGAEAPIRKEIAHGIAMAAQRVSAISLRHAAHQPAGVNGARPSTNGSRAFAAVGAGAGAAPSAPSLPTGPLTPTEIACAAAEAGNYSLKDISRTAAREAERELIFKMLQQTRWNRKETAEILGISYKALLYKIKENGLDKAS
jgi:DNA-binding NtrC family response regulator